MTSPLSPVLLHPTLVLVRLLFFFLSTSFFTRLHHSLSCSLSELNFSSPSLSLSLSLSSPTPPLTRLASSLPPTPLFMSTLLVGALTWNFNERSWGVLVSAVGSDMSSRQPLSHHTKWAGEGGREGERKEEKRKRGKELG